MELYKEGLGNKKFASAMNVNCQQDPRQMPKMPVRMFAFDFAFK